MCRDSVDEICPKTSLACLRSKRPLVPSCHPLAPLDPPDTGVDENDSTAWLRVVFVVLRSRTWGLDSGKNAVCKERHPLDRRNPRGEAASKGLGLESPSAREQACRARQRSSASLAARLASARTSARDATSSLRASAASAAAARRAFQAASARASCSALARAARSAAAPVFASASERRALCSARSSSSHSCWVALLVQHYLSNTASSVFYGITSLIRLIEFATFFTTFEEFIR